jgi:hypothetical protein
MSRILVGLQQEQQQQEEQHQQATTTWMALCTFYLRLTTYSILPCKLHMNMSESQTIHPTVRLTWNR